MPMHVPTRVCTRGNLFRALAVAMVAGVACRGEDQLSPEADPTMSPHTTTAPTPPPPPPPSSSASCTRRVNVSTVSALSNATSNALAGDCIMVAAGTYAVGVPSWSTEWHLPPKPITVEGVGRDDGIHVGGNGGMVRQGQLLAGPQTSRHERFVRYPDRAGEERLIG